MQKEWRPLGARAAAQGYLVLSGVVKGALAKRKMSHLAEAERRRHCSARESPIVSSWPPHGPVSEQRRVLGTKRQFLIKYCQWGRGEKGEQAWIFLSVPSIVEMAE